MTQRRQSRSWRNGPSERDEDEGFARWVERKLRALYDPVLSEEFPERLRRLVYDHAPQEGEGSSDAEGVDSPEDPGDDGCCGGRRDEVGGEGPG